MKHCLLFLGLFFSVFSAQAQDTSAQKPTPPWLIPDSSRAASWAVLFTPTERLNLGTHLELEAPLFKKKLHTLGFTSATVYSGELERRRFNDRRTSGAIDRQVQSISGWKLGAGLRQKFTGEPFYTDHSRLQGYAQLGGGIGWLTRKFPRTGWKNEDGAFLPVVIAQRERLYRADVSLSVGLRFYSSSGLFVNALLGVAYQTTWQGKNMNFGWPEREGGFPYPLRWLEDYAGGILNYYDRQSLIARMQLSMGWAKPSRNLHQVHFSYAQQQRKQKRFLKKEVRQEKMPDTLYRVSWTIAASPIDFLLGSFRADVEIPFRKNKSLNLLITPIFYTRVNYTFYLDEGGEGLLVGISSRFKNKVFYANSRKGQSYSRLYGGFQRFRSRTRVPSTREWEVLPYMRLDLGAEYGFRFYSAKKAPLLDFFVGLYYKQPWNKHGFVRGNDVFAFYEYYASPHFNGIAPRAGIRLGIFKRKKTDFIIR